MRTKQKGACQLLNLYLPSMSNRTPPIPRVTCDQIKRAFDYSGIQCLRELPVLDGLDPRRRLAFWWK